MIDSWIFFFPQKFSFTYYISSPASTSMHLCVWEKNSCAREKIPDLDYYVPPCLRKNMSRPPFFEKNAPSPLVLEKSILCKRKDSRFGLLHFPPLRAPDSDDKATTIWEGRTKLFLFDENIIVIIIERTLWWKYYCDHNRENSLMKILLWS